MEGSFQTPIIVIAAEDEARPGGEAPGPTRLEFLAWEAEFGSEELRGFLRGEIDRRSRERAEQHRLAHLQLDRRVAPASD